jgi:hypothetical protein
MSDIKTLRECAEYHSKMSEQGDTEICEIHFTLGILSSLAVKNLESQRIGEVVSRAHPEDALEAAKVEGWNAAIDAAAYQATLRSQTYGGEPLNLNERAIVAQIESAISALRKPTP